jgi:hypothetical protein
MAPEREHDEQPTEKLDDGWVTEGSEGSDPPPPPPPPPAAKKGLNLPKVDAGHAGAAAAGAAVGAAAFAGADALASDGSSGHSDNADLSFPDDPPADDVEVEVDVEFVGRVVVDDSGMVDPGYVDEGSSDPAVDPMATDPAPAAPVVDDPAMGWDTPAAPVDPGFTTDPATPGPIAQAPDPVATPDPYVAPDPVETPAPDPVETPEPVQTWNDGQLTPDDVIVAADGTGYTSPSEYVDGTGGYEPDAPVDPVVEPAVEAEPTHDDPMDSSY